MKSSFSLQTRFALLFGMLIMVLTIVISLVIGWRSSNYVKEEIGLSLAETAFHMADKLDQYMWARAGEITVLSQLETMRRHNDISNVQALLDGLKKSFPSFSWVGLTDINGKVLAGTDGILAGADSSSRPAFIEGRKGQFIGDVHDAVLLAKLLPNPSGEPMKFVDISTPVYDYDGNVTGVLAAHLSWEWVSEIQRSIMNPLKDRKHAEIFIVSYTDNTILLGPKELIGQKLALESVAAAKSGVNSWRIEKWPDGKEYLTGYALGNGYMDYPGLGWSVVVRQPIELAFTAVKEMQLFILLIGSVLAVIFAGLGWALSASIAKPLREIAKAADKLRFGEKIEVPPHRGIREIEILSSSLSELIHSLSDAEHELGNLDHLAHHDRLTRLPNRIGLDKFLANATALATRRGGTLTLLYLDLDGFKLVNDTMGHPAGDLLLQEVAGRLRGCIREEEIAARLGGDEFLVVLYTEYHNSEKSGLFVAKRIINAINVPFIIEGKTAQVGCSVGGAVWTGDSLPVNAVISLADKSMYRAKKAGKNRVFFAEGEDNANAVS